jgi:hypothetical protein
MTGVGFPRSHGVTPNSQDFSHPSYEKAIQNQNQQTQMHDKIQGTKLNWNLTIK